MRAKRFYAAASRPVRGRLIGNRGQVWSRHRVAIERAVRCKRRGVTWRVQDLPYAGVMRMAMDAGANGQTRVHPYPYAGEAPGRQVGFIIHFGVVAGEFGAQKSTCSSCVYMGELEQLEKLAS